MLVFVLLAWIGLSIPIALIVGMTIRRGQRPIPAHLIELPNEEPARIPAPTRS
jgi:hypothetical protein